MKQLILISIAVALQACGATTQYSTYSGSAVLRGQGGASHNVAGIDFWIYGAPNRPYQIIGYIEDQRFGGPIAMAGRERGIATQARAAGADAVIINSDSRQVMGAISNGTLNAWSTGFGGFGASSFGMTAPVIRREAAYLAIKYR